jgi:hypothetical protein
LVDPKNHDDAMACSDASAKESAWKETEIKEVHGLISHRGFKKFDWPSYRTPLPTTMVYTYKYSNDNNVTVKKCRLCVRGDLQHEGIDHFKYKTNSAMLNSRENRHLQLLLVEAGTFCLLFEASPSCF